MNGAESLVRTLLASEVDICFANPGTSEMHFVAALDRVEGMRCVLGLAEGVVTGMADGYARMAGKPAATLLHLGPGLGNGLANLHNARKAFSPVVNIVGDHASYHLQHDAPLTSDIEGIARPVSDWVKRSDGAASLAADGAQAVAASRTGQGGVATLILPADAAWEEAAGPAPRITPPPRRHPDPARIAEIAAILASGEECLIHMTGDALQEDCLQLAGRLQAHCGCRLSCPSSNGRWQRGAGRVAIERIEYPVDIALGQLATVRHVILLGTRPPVAFFAYPDKPSLLLPDGCQLHRLADIHDDHQAALSALVAACGAADTPPRLQPAEQPALHTGPLTQQAVAASLGLLMPENAIIADESVSSGRGFMPFTQGAARHDWLGVTGGSIGLGLAYATGAALACPDRKVICTEGDGSAVYNLSALWTQARENCDVVNIILNNASYAILKGELARVGVGNPGQTAHDMLTLDRPSLDWVALATGFGVPASCAETAEAFHHQLAEAISQPGPRLIDARLAG